LEFLASSDYLSFMLHDLIRKNRSYRRFFQDHRIENATLRQLVDLARLSASASNLQPLKYVLSSDPSTNEKIFPCLRWAAYLKNWPGPGEGERPSAYIVILHDTHISQAVGTDHGIAAQSILLGAAELGLGGCMIASINRTGLREALRIPDFLEIPLVLALGKPKEQVTLETVGPSGDIRYWRDTSGVHHVPKRSLDEIIIEIATEP
jgi:nitroreductase